MRSKSYKTAQENAGRSGCVYPFVDRKLFHALGGRRSPSLPGAMLVIGPPNLLIHIPRLLVSSIRGPKSGPPQSWHKGKAAPVQNLCRTTPDKAAGWKVACLGAAQDPPPLV